MKGSKVLGLVLAGLMILPPSLWAGGMVSPMGGALSILENGAEVRQIRSEMPVPEGLQMLCKGQCLVQAQGVQMVAGDQAVFALAEKAERWEVVLKSGRMDFALRAGAKMVDFHTAHGRISLEEAVFSAASSGLIRGSVIVTEKNTELLVHEGTLRVATPNGPQVMSQGKAIQLAASVLAPEGTTGGVGAAGAGATGTGLVTVGTVVGTSVGAMAAAAAIASNAAGDGGDVSPSAPASLR